MCTTSMSTNRPSTPAATAEHGLSPRLVKARADFSHSPLTAWSLVILCTASFYLGPLVLLAPCVLYPFRPRAALALFCVDLVLAFWPVAPWPRFRRACQVFYAVFDVHHNLTPALNDIARKEPRLAIFAMHPHAIIPLHGFVWGALCDQLLPDMYGYGCTTDGALVLPVLRHLLHWISAGSARKQTILTEMQAHDQNLWILPGGVAEIFLSRRRARPGAPHAHTIKARRYGLMKLALETGAVVYPAFVFGASDLLDQLAPAGNDHDGQSKTVLGVLGTAMEALSRKMGGGLTLYYGQYYLPVPHAPRLSIVLGDPIYPDAAGAGAGTPVAGRKTTCRRVEHPTPRQVEELTERYAAALHGLFEQYKAEAGYPHDTLRII